MHIHIFNDANEVGLATANIFAAQILQKPHSVLGLATGSSPIDTYKHLITFYRQGILDFSQIVTFNLDEYVSIPHDHPASYHDFMNKNLFDHVNINPNQVHVPDGNAPNLEEVSIAYDEAIDAAGGIDLQLLGIGANAHIGFNEPDSLFTFGCHVADLTPSTIHANKRFFDHENQVPKKAVSLGIGSIMKAKKIVLIATGKGKAQAIADTVKSNIDPQIPSTILRVHPNVTLLLDKEAASLL